MITKPPSFVNGAPLLFLRAEGFAVALLCVAAFSRSGASWWLFAALILVPDLSICFYLAGPRAGATAYNAVHTYLGPVALLSAAVVLAMPAGIWIALIWAAHIGIDRTLGFGLKYPDAFSSTHLGGISSRA
jgi:hypothetical protein